MQIKKGLAVKIEKEECIFVLATTSEHLTQAKAIDDKAFLEHHGITLVELESIQSSGAIVLLYYQPDDKFVGEIQILFHHIEELSYKLKSSVGYCYGVAVLPEYQNCGLGKLLFKEQEKIVKEKGLEEIHFSVRVENYSSLKLMFSCGCEIFDYSPDFYGPEPSDARLLVKQILNKSNVALSNENRDIIDVTVAFGDKRYHPAHQEISKLLTSGYKGIRITRSGLCFAKV